MIEERAQARILGRAFFSRLFESELMPPGLAQVQLVFGLVAFFAAPAMLVPLVLAKKYMFRDPETLRVMMAQDRVIAILLSMTATALVTLVIWENIFPDRRDSRHLGVLPIRLRTFVAARLSALVALFGIVFLAPTALSALSFALVCAMFVPDPGFATVLVSHFVTVSAAEAFVFFGIVTVQCLVLSALGPNVAQRAALTVQVMLVVLLLQMPLLLPPHDSFIPGPDGAPAWRMIPLASVSPPFWFLSLFECLAGYECRELAPLPSIASGLGLLTPFTALLLYATSYRRLTRLAIEGRPLPRRRTASRVRGIVSWSAAAITRTPVAAAVCGFTLRTMIRSRQHRMLLAGWMGLALALILSSMVSLVVRIGGSALEQPRTEPLAAPLILSVLVLAGIRMVMAIPTELNANWVFRLAQPASLADALDGAAGAFLVAGVAPGVLVGLFSALWLWGPAIALQHALFVALLGTGLTQVLMRGVDKVPFTCTYYPGKARFSKFWPVYLTAFTTCTYTAASIEQRLLQSPTAYALAIVMLAAAALTLWWLRRRDAERLPSLRFEEEPLDKVTVLTLS